MFSPWTILQISERDLSEVIFILTEFLLLGKLMNSNEARQTGAAVAEAASVCHPGPLAFSHLACVAAPHSLQGKLSLFIIQRVDRYPAPQPHCQICLDAC